jgi:hypothetical protein
VTTDVFSRQVELRFDDTTAGVCEDNYFDLAPGQKRSITIAGAADGGNVEVRAVNADPVLIRPEP